MKKALLLLLLITSLIEAQNIKPEDTLPVELIYFEAESFPDSVQLRWGTATELMNYGFEIQRTTYLPAWDVIGFVPGHGTSFTVHHYTFADTTALPNNLYYYRMRQIDNDGQFTYTDTVTVNYVLSVKELSTSIPAAFSVSNNYPNPFNPYTNIEFNIAESSEISLKVFNTLGELVYSHLYGRQFPGTYQINFNGSNLGSGVYIYSITAGNQSVFKTMLLLK